MTETESEIIALLQSIQRKIDRTAADVGSLKARMGAVATSMEVVVDRLDHIDDRMAVMETRLDRVLTKI